MMMQLPTVRITETKNRGRGCILTYVAPILFLCTGARTQGASAPADWHEKDAEICFRIEKDYSHALIPTISLLDVLPDEKSKSMAEWIKKNRWSQSPRINGKRSMNFLPSNSSKPVIYNLLRDFTHFVARGSLIDGTDPNASVRFEVHNEKRPLFRSPPLTVRNPVVEINVAIPAGSKQLHLVTNPRDDKYLGWAKWVDPGFMLRRQYPKVSLVRIYAPGYEIEDFVPEVFATSDGARVDSRILSVAKGEPMDIVFDTSGGQPSYLVYLAPKSRHKKPPSSWKPEAGLVLETKWTKNGFRDSDGLPEFSRAFDSIPEPVGRSFVDDIQQVFPIHRMPEHDAAGPPARGGFGLYRYTGFFPVYQGGPYIFATASNWDSYLSVDDKPVVAWQGKHSYGDGTRGEKRGSVTLAPGVHKLEYLNYNSWGSMYCLAAVQKPGEKMRPMTRTDFLPFGRYEPSAALLKDPAGAYIPFEWSAVDDFRLEQSGLAFVTVRFKALVPPGSDYSCHWMFGDGTGEAGATVDHIFLRQAIYPVRLEIRSPEKLVARSSHQVYVHSRWDWTVLNTDNVDSYDKAIQTRDLKKSPADDLVNLYVFAGQAERPDWRQLATAALAANVSRFVQDCRDSSFILNFGQYLRSAELRQYDKALDLFTRLGAKGGTEESARRNAAICRAELLVEHFGRGEEALNILEQVQTPNSSADRWTRRAAVAKAEALLGLGKAKEATELIRQFDSPADPSAEIKQQIKHSGLLRHARFLARTQDDPNQWDQAMSMIDTIVAEAPAKIFAPNVSIVKLDIYLARKEFQAALYLAERLGHLQLNDYDRAEVLMRQVIASCGLKDMDKARSAYARLSKDFPYSPALAQAKNAIMETFAGQ